MRILFALLLLLPLSAEIACAQDKLANSPKIQDGQSVDASEKQREIKASDILWKCYSDGVDVEFNKINIAANNFIRGTDLSKASAFKFYLLSTGSFTSMAKRVHQECNEALRQFKLVSSTDAENGIIKVNGSLFLLKMALFEKDYVKECRKDIKDDIFKDKLDKLCSMQKKLADAIVVPEM